MLYAEVPVFLQFAQNKFFYETGITLAALLSQKEEGVFALKNRQFKFRPYEAGIALGAGLNLSKKTQFVVHYQYSLLPIRLLKTNAALYDFTAGQYNHLLTGKLIFLL